MICLFQLLQRIFVRKDDNDTTEEIDTNQNKTKFLVTGLQPFTTYSFRVSASNNIGSSDPSKESFHTQTHRESKTTTDDDVELTLKFIILQGPSDSPKFLRNKMTSFPTSLEVLWDPPSASSINGEFLGINSFHSKIVSNT